MARSGQSAGEETTRERLLWRGVRLFAERGYRGTSLRDVTAAAGANLASIKYYFGDKAAFYQECFRFIWRHNPSPIDALDLAVIRTRQDWLTAINSMTREIAALVLDDHRNVRWLTGMMSREMAAPTPALGLVMSEFITPRLNRFEALLTMGLPPRASVQTQRLWGFCALGQLMMFALARPAAERIFGKTHGNTRFTAALARHVADGITRQLNFRPPERKRGS